MRRQQLLQQPGSPRYRALLDEAALRRQVGGKAVMNAQLDNILQLVAEEKATVQVIPYEVGGYAAMDSNFDYLEFRDTPLPGIVFVEGLIHLLYLEKPAELARYSEALEHLRDTALSPRDSTKLIAEIRAGQPGNP
jgi:hypothetical protein